MPTYLKVHFGDESSEETGRKDPREVLLPENGDLVTTLQPNIVIESSVFKLVLNITLITLLSISFSNWLYKNCVGLS